MKPYDPNTPPLQDHFFEYDPLPGNTLETPQRRVYCESEAEGNHGREHALGAGVVYLIEGRAVLEETEWNTVDYYRAGQDLVSAVSFMQKLKYFAQTAELPYKKLRKEQKVVKEQMKLAAQALVTRDIEIRNGLDYVRQEINDLPERTLELYDEKIGDTVPPFIKFQYEHDIAQQEAAGTEPQRISSWLVEPGELGDARLINFLKFRVDRIERDQDKPDLVQAVEKQKAEWLAGVKKGVKDGWLHPDSLRSEERMEQLTVRHGDYFDLYARGRSGYALRADVCVVLGTDIQSVKHAAKHEFNHVLLGSFSETWLDEAITEHIAQVLDGQRDVEDMSYIAYNDSSYREPRDIIEALTDLGTDLTIADFTRAYSKGDAASSDMLTLSVRVARALGMEEGNPMKLLSEHINRLYTQEIENGGSRQTALMIACDETRSDLCQQPGVVFGEAWYTRCLPSDTTLDQVAS